ncbi:hypothetical protein AALO_G00221240 [Alosa alosa]|uniref:Uncharacterized protein n=1 Tax=Alosa alosa TaxID=278164 RepID=A0AAV6FX12_9TELE|nr:hypothetical protein AALO_G00221240 [Alosa alosa]
MWSSFSSPGGPTSTLQTNMASLPCSLPLMRVISLVSKSCWKRELTRSGKGQMASVPSKRPRAKQSRLSSSEVSPVERGEGRTDRQTDGQTDVAITPDRRDGLTPLPHPSLQKNKNKSSRHSTTHLCDSCVWFS